MFELASTHAIDAEEIVIFSDKLLQDKFNKIRAIFDIKGYPSERKKSFQYRTPEYSESEQMKDVSSDDGVLDSLSSTTEVLQLRIKALNADEQKQGISITEFEATIEQCNESCAVALVKDDNSLIQQIEDTIVDCEAGIRKAERRKTGIRKARATIAQYLEIVQSMWRILDERNRTALEEEARAILYDDIKAFAEKVADYQEMRRTLKPIPYKSDDHILKWIIEGLPLKL